MSTELGARVSGRAISSTLFLDRGPSLPAAVLLDFGGTLDADGVPWATRFLSAYREAGNTINEEEFRTAFRESDRRLAELPGIRVMGFRAMVQAQAGLLQELLPGSRPDRDWVADRFYLGAVAVTRRNRTVLEELRRAGHRLAVVSNFTGNLHHCLEELGLDGYFDVIIDSAIVGWTKPDPRIFQAATEALKVPGESSPGWMVGDNPEADIRPAEALGLRSVWIAPARRETPADLKATVRIHSLAQLPAVLERH
jgi:putative hydrolase of the HAD superfamily